MNQGRIYIIDDDENALRLAKRVLEKNGFEVRANDRVIGTTSSINDFEPDVVLLDVMMPALSGDKYVKILRQGVRSNPGIILLSNKSDAELKQIVAEVGADGYVSKIQGTAAMLQTVQEHMRKRPARAPGT